MRSMLTMVLAVFCLGAFCPRRPTPDATCQNGQTRCGVITDGGVPRAEVCQEGGWYPSDPTNEACPAETVCCLTLAPRASGHVSACALPSQCIHPALDGGNLSDGAAPLADPPRAKRSGAITETSGVSTVNRAN